MFVLTELYSEEQGIFLDFEVIFNMTKLQPV